jgi:hypothetical protein
MWLVWPTRYRYDRLKGETSEIPVRIDRVTGRAEGLSASGWFPLRGPESIDPSMVWLSCDVFNGSNWKVNTLIAAVAIHAPKVEVPSRNYKLVLEDGSGSPSESSRWQARLRFPVSGEDLNQLDADFTPGDLEIVKARGVRVR